MNVKKCKEILRLRGNIKKIYRNSNKYLKNDIFSNIYCKINLTGE